MRHLPVGAAFKHTVKSTLNNFGFAFHISWPWMLALLPLNVVGNIYVTLNSPPQDTQNPWNLPPDIAAAHVLMGVCALVAFGSIAVAWHRYILLDEVPQGLGRLRLDQTVWRYVGFTIVIAVVSAVLGAVMALPFGLVAGLAMTAGQAGLIIAVPALALAFVCVIASSLRLGIKLPAVAMDNDTVSLRSAWDMTRGNHWRCGALFALVFACLIIVGLVFGGVTTLLAQGQSILALVTVVVVQMGVNWVATIWNVTLLTSLYGFFVEERDF